MLTHFIPFHILGGGNNAAFSQYLSSLPHSFARDENFQIFGQIKECENIRLSSKPIYIFACERFTFSDSHKVVTGLISVSGPSSLCDQREFPGHCHSLLIDDTDKNPFDANYLQNMFFTLCNFTS